MSSSITPTFSRLLSALFPLFLSPSCTVGVYIWFLSWLLLLLFPIDLSHRSASSSFFFSFPFSVWTLGHCMAVWFSHSLSVTPVCFLIHAHFNKLAWKAVQVPYILQNYLSSHFIALPLLLTVISLFYPLFPEISLNIFFLIFFASVPGICLEDYRCLFRFSLRTAEKDRKPDARMTYPDTVLCVRIWHKQKDTHSCTLIVFTVTACAIWPQTLFRRLQIEKKHVPSEWDVTSSTVTGSLENFMVAVTAHVVIWRVSTSPWSPVQCWSTPINFPNNLNPRAWDLVESTYVEMGNLGPQEHRTMVPW